MSGVEKASGQRSIGTYPDDWGMPRGTLGSEERANWVMDHVLRMENNPTRKLEKAEVALLRDLRRALRAQAEGKDIG